MFILDTNVVSELLRPIAEPSVVGWVAARDASHLFLTAVTEAELRFGVEIMPAGARRDAVGEAIDALLREDFAGRILPFDSPAAVAYAEFAAARRAAGRPAAHADAQIAAIASVHRMSVVTRNVGDFAGAGLDIVNPWSAGEGDVARP
ncbi:PIN domain-containing protein [Candidatus Poriferisodalis sp.]|uniref:PIN domain-containing protein n=1 Tax=Candidatus Poriferisodalis sp. TaxID=3101277 RepID=UPI003B023B5D